MCINCLKKRIEAINEYEKEVKTSIENITCECCKRYPNFLLGVNDDLKVLCLTKIKKEEQVCLNGINHLKRFESMVKMRIKNKLQYAMENIDEIKHEIEEMNYINKMNDLKALSDFVEDIDSVDHTD